MHQSYALFIATATLFSACAPRYTLATVDFTPATSRMLVEASTAQERSEVSFPGVRFKDAPSGTDRDAFIGTVNAMAEACPALDDALLLVDCSGRECYALVWGNPVYGAELDGRPSEYLSRGELWPQTECSLAQLGTVDVSVVAVSNGEDLITLTKITDQVQPPRDTDYEGLLTDWQGDAGLISFAQRLNDPANHRESR